MGQEFIIKSQALEDKVNQLLPSQGGFQAGVDLSASTTVIPIIDLTETAEGSDVRADLQTALSLNSITTFALNNQTATLITTTGYYRVFGNSQIQGSGSVTFSLTDGVTTKLFVAYGSGGDDVSQSYDFIVFLPAGNSLTCTCSSASANTNGNTRQIADVSGNLINPL